jgi:hypothetical protein
MTKKVVQAIYLILTFKQYTWKEELTVMYNYLMKCHLNPKSIKTDVHRMVFC